MLVCLTTVDLCYITKLMYTYYYVYAHDVKCSISVAASTTFFSLCLSPLSLPLFLSLSYTLTEILDYGYPQKTESGLLKTYITQQGVRAQVCDTVLQTFDPHYISGTCKLASCDTGGYKAVLMCDTKIIDTLSNSDCCFLGNTCESSAIKFPRRLF